MPKPIDLLQASRPNTLKDVRLLPDKARHDATIYFSSLIVNPNSTNNAFRGGDVIVSSELWAAGTTFTV